MYSTGGTSTNGQLNTAPTITPLANTVTSKVLSMETKKKTTVFIGNISEFTNDEFMQNLMSKCGTIDNWKRVLGSNGKYQSFGFCEYQDQEAGLRAMRLLNGYKLGDKLLVVKVDAKTRALLDEYENKNKFQANKRVVTQKYQLPISTMTFIRAEQDTKAQTEIDKLVEGSSEMLSGKSNCSILPIHSSKLNLINEEGQVSDDNLDTSISNDFKRNSLFHLNTTNMDEEDITYEKRRIERKNLEKQKLLKDRIKRWENYENHLEDEFNYIENKIKKKNKRKKEFEEKLTKFISSYDDDINDEKYYKYDAWDDKLNQRNEEMERDELDEANEADELEELKKKREKDLQNKVNSLKIELPMLNSTENLNNDDNVVPTQEQESQLETTKELSSYNMDVIVVPTTVPVEVEEDSINPINYSNTTEMIERIDDTETKSYDPMIEVENYASSREIKTKTIDKKQEWSTIDEKSASLLKEFSKEKRTFGLKITTSLQSNTSSQSTNSIIMDSDISQFHENDRDEVYVKKKTKLTMITDAEHKEVPLVELPPGYHAESMTAEEKKKRIKKIISSIPTDKNELFSHKVLWDHVDKRLIEERIKPWISRKIKELIGVEENTLIDYICTKVFQQSRPQEIIEAISMILENESEEFTIKLWRFLIYEAIAKMYGLNNCSKSLK